MALTAEIPLVPGQVVCDDWGEGIGHDFGYIISTARPEAQPWVQWTCRCRCQGHWRPDQLFGAMHVLTGEPLLRGELFDIEAVERAEYEARVVL